MANITATLLNNSIPTIIAAKALGYLKANTVLARLVNRDWSNEVARYGQVVSIPSTGALVANNKSANTVVTLQVPDDSSAAITFV